MHLQTTLPLFVSFIFLCRVDCVEDKRQDTETITFDGCTGGLGKTVELWTLFSLFLCSIMNTRCSMRETRETALLHAWVQSPNRPHNHRQLHQFIACIFIYSTKLPQRKNYECQKYEKKSPIHKNADANITCKVSLFSISLPIINPLLLFIVLSDFSL